MKFDSNKAWSAAMAAIRANREILLALGGVFFLLPTLLSTVFLSDLQTKMMDSMGKPEVMASLMEDNTGSLMLFGLGGVLTQMLGYLAITALLSDPNRPTVGDCIRRGGNALLSLFGVGILCFVALTVVTTVASMVLIGVFSALGMAGLGATVAIFAMVAVACIVSVKLSLVVPIIVNEGVRSPIMAMRRSWALTRGQTGRLLSFYGLLAIAYFVLAMVASLLLIAPLVLILGTASSYAILASGLVSGAIGAVTSVVFAAVISQTHRQLAGPSVQSVINTFE